MEKSKRNMWLIIGVIFAVILLMIWLFVGTTLEEVTPVIDTETLQLGE